MYECEKCGNTSQEDGPCKCGHTIVTIDVKKLTAAYNKAVKEGKEDFEYNGHGMFTNYVKYLLEYINSNLIIKKK